MLKTKQQAKKEDKTKKLNLEGSMVLSSRRCCHLICAEKLVLALSALKVEVSNGNFPNLLTQSLLYHLPHFLEAQFTT